MRISVIFGAGALGLLTIASLIGPAWDLPPVDGVQVGYRGTGMEIIRDREASAQLAAANVAPPPPYEADGSGPKMSELTDQYQNVQVLGHLSEDQFNQFMASITEWVSPEQGCAYCHNEENLASDEVYTKVVARRMIQMNQAINADWTAHVKETGVTCYTCHRGQPVPQNVWFNVSTDLPKGWAGYREAQNLGSAMTGYTSLPEDALQRFLLGEENIRVHSANALPTGENKMTTKNVEHTYSLMVHMSDSLGVNCVACHNSRAFNDWDQSPPQRVTAWHGIRMARALNNEYLTGLAPVFPDNRKGPLDDVAKVNCATCHNGAQKPLLGVSMLKDYVDSLGAKSVTTAPDYNTYKPGVPGPFPPAQSSALPAATQVAKVD